MSTSIVNTGAPKSKGELNSQHTELPTTCNQTSVDVVDCPADRCANASRDARGSPAQTLTGIRSPPDACQYISGYDQLSNLGVGFYPIHPDKSPAVEGKLERQVTTDPSKIRFWAEYRHHRSFALRIRRGSRLIVVDTESPFKHRGELGPDGEMVLYGLLEDRDITLPLCPTVQTPSDGFHRYLLVPKGFRIGSAISLWPGIDILAVGSNVILPGGHTDAGQYRIRRSFEECPIPEAPREFIKLIRKAQRAKAGPNRSDRRSAPTVPDCDTSVVSSREWFLLFRIRVFRRLWNRKWKAADKTDSAYEYHLAKACFCCGLDLRQTEHVVLTWRKKHGLQRSVRKLRNGIIPGAWQEVASWVESWRAERAAAEDARKATKTSNMILAYIRDTGEPQTPSSIASALPIPRERAKKAMQRLAKEGKLLRMERGFTVAAGVGTFSRITTPL